MVILKGAVKEPLFALKEGKNTFPAQILSDGTLRFAALTAALFQPNTPGLLLLEEIENGIHPTRLRLLVELLRSRAKLGKPQVLATTHSPIVLAWLKPKNTHTPFSACGTNAASRTSNLCRACHSSSPSSSARPSATCLPKAG